jgi:tellurite resistance protein
MHADLHQPAATHARLAEFPVGFFSIVMGLLGFTLALHAAEQTLGLEGWGSAVALALGIAAFLAIALLYALKMLRHPDAVRAEWAHPVRLAFFPAFSISLLLIATALLPHAPETARLIWLVAVVVQAILTLSVIANWIGTRAFLHAQLSPAWFIPAVGNVLVPVAGAGLGFVELSWLFFSAGLIFWIILLTLVINRLIFHDPLPERLYPTLVILIAPPSVAFIAYMKLGGDVDAFARILLNSGYVFAAVVATQLPRFRRLPFALPWWALSFPLAALAVASLLFAEVVGSNAHRLIGLALAALLAVVIVGLAWRSGKAIIDGEICRPE